MQDDNHKGRDPGWWPARRGIRENIGRVGVTTVIGSDGWTAELALVLLADLHGMVTATTPKAAAEEDVVFLSVRWTELAETSAITADWEGRILIDATGPALPGQVADIRGRTSSEIVSELSPGAQLVKAFNTLPPEILAAEPQQGGGRRVIFFAGDHARAKVEVGRLIMQMEFVGVDLGSLASGGRLLQSPDGPLWGRNLVSFELWHLFR